MLQLGIGGTPSVIGEMIAESDLKDLGMHTELAADAYYRIFESGKLTNKHSNLIKGKGIAGIFMGKDLQALNGQNTAIQAILVCLCFLY